MLYIHIYAYTHTYIYINVPCNNYFFIHTTLRSRKPKKPQKTLALEFNFARSRHCQQKKADWGERVASSSGSGRSRSRNSRRPPKPPSLGSSCRMKTTPAVRKSTHRKISGCPSKWFARVTVCGYVATADAFFHK